jgi:uncharacterized protein YqjF (DUF2071 family)
LNKILQQTAHRPWPLPSKPWAYYQEWNQVLFLHYPVDKKELSDMLPKGLVLDLFEGQAWISLVAFTMEKIRPRILPPFSPISNFHEFNVRTYVRHQEKAGVYFLSVEGAKKISCWMARTLSDLPYRFASMQRKKGFFVAKNPERARHVEVHFEVGELIEEKTALELWLTERYGLFQDAGDSINAFDLHHAPWTLHEASLKEIQFDYPAYNVLLNQNPALMHFSSGVQVCSWNPISY